MSHRCPHSNTTARGKYLVKIKYVKSLRFVNGVRSFQNEWSSYTKTNKSVSSRNKKELVTSFTGFQYFLRVSISFVVVLIFLETSSLFACSIDRVSLRSHVEPDVCLPYWQHLVPDNDQGSRKCSNKNRTKTLTLNNFHQN